MNSRVTFAASVLTAAMTSCSQNSPPPPTSPSIPPVQELPTKPRDNPLPPNTPNSNPSVPPGQPSSQ